MGISRSSYYTWVKRGYSKKYKENEKLFPFVLEAAKRSKWTYGTRRMAKEIQDHGIPCGRRKARTLMKITGVKVDHRIVNFYF